jgi:hypothetical protein
MGTPASVRMTSRSFREGFDTIVGAKSPQPPDAAAGKFGPSAGPTVGPCVPEKDESGQTKREESEKILLRKRLIATVER